LKGIVSPGFQPGDPARQFLGELMKNVLNIKALDISVATLAMLSCLLIVPEIPVWSLFIGWAWYYTLGGGLHVFKQATPPMLAGSILAFACFILMSLMSPPLPALLSTMICVFITVFALMMVLKIPAFSQSLPAFNGYSCVFIGYAAGSYLHIESMPPMLNAFLWITGANFLGLVFGWVSLEVERILKEKFPDCNGVLASRDGLRDVMRIPFYKMVMQSCMVALARSEVSETKIWIGGRKSA
jgi:hypothetical protein